MIEIQYTKTEKDLGILLDHQIDFGKHITQKVKKASRMFVITRRTFRYRDTDTCKPLFVALVRSHIEYANPV